ncbi:MAG: hypothetical protein HY717_14995 [Planctomycetes bacterium]|nr:hypothetical protein [Planctomycetota bacterium]
MGFLMRQATAQTRHSLEAHTFASMAVSEGDFSFRDKHAGNDMLPYTADDLALPECGNREGTLYFTHIDLNSNNQIDMFLDPRPESKGLIQEHLFVQASIGTDDEESFCLAMQSHAEYGIFYESEDFNDLHHAFNDGLGRSSDPCDPNVEYGGDFSHHDRPGWEGEWNAYVYNNLRASQHGRDKPKYFFELINPSNTAAIPPGDFAYDEIEGFQKPCSLQNSMNDPLTGSYNERGNCRRDWMRSYKGITRGYLIPVADLPKLKNGDLPTLFGWENIDLAGYFRDKIAPILDDPNANAADPHCPHGSGIQSESLFPPTQVMLYQLEVPIEVGPASGCGSNNPGENTCPTTGKEITTPAEQARCQAAYWGIEVIDETTGRTNAKYRVSVIYVHHDLVLPFAFPDLSPWRQVPEDGREKNLWLLDHFTRNVGNFPAPLTGKYTFEPPETMWRLYEDPNFLVFDGTRSLVAASSGPGAASAPLPRPISSSETPVEVVADMAVDTTVEMPQGGGAGLEGASFQLILRNGNSVIAYADIKKESTAVHIGGSYDPATGVASNPTASAAGVGSTLGIIDRDPLKPPGGYTRYVLRLTSRSISLREALHIEYRNNDFLKLESQGDELASLTVPDPSEDIDFGAGVATVTVGGTDRTVLQTLALFAGFPPLPGGLQLPGDCNQDGEVDQSDAICILSHLFLGGPPTSLPCGNGQISDPGNLALLDFNDDTSIDQSDAISILLWRFVGGPPHKLGIGCVPIKGCPKSCNP